MQGGGFSGQLYSFRSRSEADNYRSRKQNRIFQGFGRLFLPGTLKNVPFSLIELLINFREESSGIGRRLEFQWMANWPAFDKKVEAEIIILLRNRRPFRAIRPVSKKKSKLGQLAIRWNFEPAKSANPTRFLSKMD